jgi:hypothetical protein
MAPARVPLSVDESAGPATRSAQPAGLAMPEVWRGQRAVGRAVRLHADSASAQHERGRDWRGVRVSAPAYETSPRVREFVDEVLQAAKTGFTGTLALDFKDGMPMGVRKTSVRRLGRETLSRHLDSDDSET